MNFDRLLRTHDFKINLCTRLNGGTFDRSVPLPNYLSWLVASFLAKYTHLILQNNASSRNPSSPLLKTTTLDKKRTFYTLKTACYALWYYTGQKKKNILEIRGGKNAVPRVIIIMLDPERSAQGKAQVRYIRDCPRLLTCADHAWSSIIMHTSRSLS